MLRSFLNLDSIVGQDEDYIFVVYGQEQFHFVVYLVISLTGLKITIGKLSDL